MLRLCWSRRSSIRPSWPVSSCRCATTQYCAPSRSTAGKHRRASSKNQREVLYIYYIYIHRACISWSSLLPKPANKSTHKSTDQSRMEFPELSVTVNQSETEFDDVIISDWPSVIIWLLIGRRHWQALKAFMLYLYNIYIYNIQYLSMVTQVLYFSDHTTFKHYNVYHPKSKPIGIWEWGMLYKVEKNVLLTFLERSFSMDVFVTHSVRQSRRV